MNLFLLNIFLALGFSAVLGQVNLSGFISGFVVGYAALWLTKPLYGTTRYFERLPGVLGLISFFGKELLVSNLKVLWDVLTPRHISRPGIIGLPLDARTDVEIMLVANLISLTPGNLKPGPVRRPASFIYSRHVSRRYRRQPANKSNRDWKDVYWR